MLSRFFERLHTRVFAYDFALLAMMLLPLIGGTDTAGAESELLPPTSTPSFSMRSMTIESLSRKVTCHTRRKFPRPGATGHCLSYTTAPAFSSTPPSKGVDIVPVQLEPRELETNASVFSYPFEEIPELQRKRLEKIATECAEMERNNTAQASTPKPRVCEKEDQLEIIKPILPKQVAILELPSGEIRSQLVHSVSHGTDPIYATYDLHILPKGGLSWPSIEKPIAFGLNDSNLISWRRIPSLSTTFEARRTSIIERAIERTVFLRNIPRLANYGTPEIVVIPYPDLSQIELEDSSTMPGLLTFHNTPGGRSAAEHLLVVLRSQRTEARTTPAETRCDGVTDEGHYWVPTWNAFFLVRDNQWSLLYDEIRDFRRDVLSTITFVDLNQDDRRDIILSGKGTEEVILTSQGKGFRKWGELEISPCGC